MRVGRKKVQYVMSSCSHSVDSEQLQKCKVENVEKDFKQSSGVLYGRKIAIFNCDHFIYMSGPRIALHSTSFC